MPSYDKEVFPASFKNQPLQFYFIPSWFFTGFVPTIIPSFRHHQLFSSAWLFLSAYKHTLVSCILKFLNTNKANKNKLSCPHILFQLPFFPGAISHLPFTAKFLECVTGICLNFLIPILLSGHSTWASFFYHHYTKSALRNVLLPTMLPAPTDTSLLSCSTSQIIWQGGLLPSSKVILFS